MRRLKPLPDRPFISIIVPSLNQGAFIRQTIDSILFQEYRPLEVIVVDGASTDGTLEILHAYDKVPEVRWTSEPDTGVADAVNKGLSRARGQIGAIQSSNDFYLSGAVRLGIEALQSQSGLGFVFGDILTIQRDETVASSDILPPFSLEDVLAGRTSIPQSSTFFRIDLARELGGWREEVSYAADLDLWLRMAMVSQAKKIDETMAVHRVHPDRHDGQGERIFRDYARMLQLLLEDANVPNRFRRAAAAGLLIMANRYRTGENTWIKLMRLWRAAWLYPPLRKQIAPGALIPGWYPARNHVTRIYQSLRCIA